MELFLLLLFPIFWPFFARKIWKNRITMDEMMANIGLVMLVVMVCWFAGRYSSVFDTEVLNTRVVEKTREHGTYLRSYSCNCRTDSKGNRTCSTCYERHYTVTWFIDTFFGPVTLDHVDRTTRAVYSYPNPQIYKDCKIGDPASITRSFTNYVKAVPETLFSFKQLSKEELAEVPKYPSIFDEYKYRHTIQYHFNEELPSQVTKDLALGLRDLGEKKRLNALLVFTSLNVDVVKSKFDSAWKAGKRNNIILFFQVQDQKVVETATTLWVNNIGNETFAAGLRQMFDGKDIKEIPKILLTSASASYKLPDDKVFDYLKDDIETPSWCLILSIIISIAGSVGLSIYFANNEVNEYGYRQDLYRGHRRGIY